MSTHSQIKTDIKDVKALTSGIEKYLEGVVSAQEDREVGVTFDPEGRTVRMHGSENTECTEGVISFDDTQYQIGVSRNEDGTVKFDYDSWVDGGKLSRRIDGEQVQGSAGNMKLCLSLSNTHRQLRRKGVTMRTAKVKDEGGRKRLVAFVPSK